MKQNLKSKFQNKPLIERIKLEAEIGQKNVESGFDALQKALLDWNLTCPIGAFGIYLEKWHLYHKYNYPMPLEIDPAEMALEAFYILNLILDTIYVIYPQTVKLISAA